ncbi:hypothetical protein Pla123a_13220 [Posidoniimonas polymericola]|uniref:Uncharacterized protein n=1 Tax=Posidoniimonas polymericola TaxID=2528002 RepID=A0A5C5YU43_9BACT|nr:hypothetical protein [Posidoniimonas polymericola]TWT78529.1 hypothetical protein Pla123a_13220 [Posidoniimonas polymericola]
MHAGTRVTKLQLAANGLIVLLTLALLSTDARGSDIIGLGGELPVLEFDVPAALTCRDVTPADYRPALPGDRLLEVRVPVSVVVLRGEVRRVREVIIEIDGAEAGLRVHDFAPNTQLASEQAKDYEVKRTEERREGLDASLGGALPIAGGTAHLTPSVTTGRSTHTTSTVTETRLAPKQAVLVSGAVNRRQGVYFKLRQSSQTTLEGEHELTVTFVAPAEWTGGELQVECVGRGEKKWLFVKQRKVWNSTRTPIELRLARHVVAKPTRDADCECCCSEEPLDNEAALTE